MKKEREQVLHQDKGRKFLKLHSQKNLNLKFRLNKHYKNQSHNKFRHQNRFLIKDCNLDHISHQWLNKMLLYQINPQLDNRIRLEYHNKNKD